MTIAIDVGGRYDVLSLLGEGGLGKVYLARDTVAGQQVALKLLNDRVHDDVDWLRFKQQFRTMARLRHPNLCLVHDCGVTPDGALYYTTDYVPGEDLTARIPMREAALRALLPQLGSVLGYLHQQGFVYGDLKPQNLRVMPDGTLKLLDIERLLRTSDAGAMPKGSLAYMAPEMVKGRRLDSRADLYALGATCYHLITGAPPYSGSSPLEVLRAHLTRRPRPLRHVVDGVSAALEHAVLRMMAIEPVARYRSVAEALAELGVETDDAGAVTLEGVFVGREEAVAELVAALGALRDGRGQALWVVGGTGAGKSRLLDELRVLAQLDEVPFYAGRAGEARTPYAPFVEVLRAVLARAPQLSLGSEERAALAHLLPELADGHPDTVLEPLEERARIQAAIAHVLHVASEPTGLVLALDDWDQADPSSAEAMAYLLRHAQGMRVLLVAARREAPGDGRVLTLEPLSAREAKALASSMLGEEAPADFVAAINRWTGGSPGHFRRAIAHMVRTGSLTRRGGHWQYPLESPEFDADFRATLVAPLASLPALPLLVAQAASVAGSEADLKMLVDLCALDEEALFAALDELAQREVLQVRDGRARFVAGGLEEALYDSIPEPRRLELHAAVAERLQAREERLEVGTLTALARHLLLSRQIVEAMPAVLRAADANMAVFGVDTARKLLRDALALMAEQPEVHARARRDALVRLAQVERWRGDLDALDACLDEGLPLAERLEEPGPTVRLMLLRGVGQTLRMTPEALKAGAETLERACALAAEPAFEARCRFSLAQNYFYQGETVTSRAAFERAARVAEGAGQPFWHAKSLAFLGYLQATGHRAGRELGLARLAEAADMQTRLGDRYGRSFTAALQGDALLQAWRLREAGEAFATQLAIDEALGVGEDRVTSLANLATVQALAGRLGEASETCERALPLATQHGHPVRVLILAVRAFVRAWLGDLPNALADLRALAETGGGYMALHAAPFQIAAWTRLGHAEEASGLAEQSLAALKMKPEQALEGQLKALWGQARLARGDVAGAAAALEQAPDPTDASLASFFALRLRAMLRLHAGALDEARELAERARLLAEQAGALGFTAEMIAFAAQCSLAAGHADASSRFRAAQALADREGMPLLRAIALHGQAEAEPSAERGAVMAAEAKQILRTLAHGLAPRDREVFLAIPACARILEERPVLHASLDIQSGPQMLGRIKALSDDLLGFAGQYGALFAQWTASNRQLEMLNALARRINASLDLDAVLRQVVTLTLELTQAERAFVLLAEGEGLVCRAAADRHGPSGLDARVSLTVCRKVLTSGQPVTVLDTTLDAAFQAQASIEALELRTLMCVPLAAHGRQLGVLYVDSQAVVDTFTSRELELLEAIASHASLAIGNATLYDETRRRAAELEEAVARYQEAEQRANTDMLTGLHNRRSFEEIAARLLDGTRRYGRALSVVLMDVDHFKKVNDTYGHAIGDDVLKVVSSVIASCARAADVPARLGGEEFVVICPETGPDGAAILAERIRLATEKSHTDFVGTPPITISLGIAPVFGDDKSVAEALARADQALYACKHGGRNQYRIWEAE